MLWTLFNDVDDGIWECFCFCDVTARTALRSHMCETSRLKCTTSASGVRCDLSLPSHVNLLCFFCWHIWRFSFFTTTATSNASTHKNPREPQNAVRGLVSTGECAHISHPGIQRCEMQWAASVFMSFNVVDNELSSARLETKTVDHFPWGGGAWLWRRGQVLLF